MMESHETSIAQVEALLESGYHKLDIGEIEVAIKTAREAIHRCAPLPADVTASYRYEGYLIIGEACMELRDDDDAFRAYDDAIEIEPAAPDAWFGVGRLRLMRWEFEPAKDAFERSMVHAPDDLRAAVSHHRAIIAQFEGDHELAETMFHEADRLDSENFPLPTSISHDDVLSLLDDLVRELPEPIQAALENVVFDVVDLPDPEIDGREHSPVLLGLYNGSTVAEQVFSTQVFPTTIRIFRHNIERVARDSEELRDELRITILHEIGHHLGWDEDDLAERGLD